jgi:hypothetical protein
VLNLLFFVCEAVFLLIETFKQKHIMTNILVESTYNRK